VLYISSSLLPLLDSLENWSKELFKKKIIVRAPPITSFLKMLQISSTRGWLRTLNAFFHRKQVAGSGCKSLKNSFLQRDWHSNTYISPFLWSMIACLRRS